MIAFAASASGAEDPHTVQTIEPGLVHLRNKPEWEWSDFPETAERAQLKLTFNAVANEVEHAILLRQQDVKQQWVVTLNGRRLGELVRDENDMTMGLAVPVDGLKNGENLFVVEMPAPAKTPADDIRIGQIRWHRRSLNAVLSAATLEVTVTDAQSKELTPCRITVIDAQGSLTTFATISHDRIAIRPGTAFTANGLAVLKLPAGNYTVLAGRGFEYSLAQAGFTAHEGETHRQTLSIRREVPTAGFVACDTHVHTLTHSGHGDATIEERMITLAGEGIELPIATDHNVHVDYEPIARKLDVRRYFTPVIGNEVTTARGHFNVFPVQAGARVPDHKQTDWGLLFDDIQRTPGVKMAILNHARDLHSGVRPFGPALHNALVGENLEGWPLRFQGMEVVNSGATQTDVLQLFHDWMGLLNRGYQVTAVGSSDSHDVARHFPGQARTYLRCDDRDPGNLDVDAAVSSFLQGRAMVSYGLLTEMTVNGKYSCGELATVPDPEVRIDIRVLGPHWVQADRLLLYVNGALIRDESIGTADDSRIAPIGVLWSDTWKIPRPKHDAHLIAIALGPGVKGLHWRTAKPYQPTSTDPATHVIGCSGAIWLDVDENGRRTSARDYAQRLMAERRDAPQLISRLNEFDEATAAQVAHLLRVSGAPLQDEAWQSALKSASASVQAGFRKCLEAWRANEIARVTP